MWEFFGIIVEQLTETFRWFFTGFSIIIFLLILLYNNNLLSNKGPLSFIKKVSYYMFFPLYIGIICWFTSATIIVEKDAIEIAKITLEKAENSIFPQFSKYILSLADDWIDGELSSKEELVNKYLEANNYEKGNISTKAMEWTLVNGIEYIENKAIEKGTLKIGDEKINFPLLISDYLNGADGMAKIPFNYLKGLSLSSIHNYAKSFYWIYFFMGFVVIIILSLVVYINLKNRKVSANTNFVNPSTTLDNNQKSLDNSIVELDNKKSE